MSTLTVCFVYQAGDIAVKARQLLESIRRFSSTFTIYLGIPLPTEIYGVVPQDELDQLVRTHQVKILYFENSISHTYKIGNKIQLLFEVSKVCEGPLLFLDSDILQLSPFLLTPQIVNSDLTMKLADARTYQYPSYLIEKYSLKKGEYLTTGTREKMVVPYCNAGFIFCGKSGLRKNFPAEWLRVAKELFNDQQVTNKFPWLDQIAIPIVVELLKLELNLVGEEYNYPYHVRKNLREGIVFCHYHSLANLRRITS